MAIDRVAIPTPTAPVDLTDYQAQLDQITALNQAFTGRNIVDGSTIHAGSVMMVGGVLYKSTSDTTITGALSKFVKITPSGATAAAAFVASLSGVAWNHAYGGYYDGSGNLHLFDEARAANDGDISVAYTLQGQIAYLKGGLDINGALSGVTSLSMGGALSGVTSLSMGGALSGATTINASGAVSGASLAASGAVSGASLSVTNTATAATVNADDVNSERFSADRYMQCPELIATVVSATTVSATGEVSGASLAANATTIRGLSIAPLASAFNCYIPITVGGVNYYIACFTAVTGPTWVLNTGLII